MPNSSKITKLNPLKSASDLRLLVDQGSEILLGKRHEIELSVACLIARGHLLIEDVPGVGKTTLIKLLSKMFGLPFKRIQFTNDLLPADITGTSIFDSASKSFHFHPGPLFSNLVLADELNRATPKTQSALLQAMEEAHVTVDHLTHSLPQPFFVVATQNPAEQYGTFPLPESQLDRFLMRVQLGFPDRESERTLLLGEERMQMLNSFESTWVPEDLLRLQKKCEEINVSKPLADYVLDILEKSRDRAGAGLSPRAGLSLLRAARAWALLQDRQMVIPEDVQVVAPAVINHRLWWLQGAGSERTSLQAARDLVLSVPVR